MKSKLKDVIDMNAINEEKLFQAVLMDIRESILKEVCECMKSDDKKMAEVKAIYCRQSDNDTATRIVVHNICHLEMPDDDIEWLTTCILAFFHKRPRRATISPAVKKGLLQKQANRCAICGRTISDETLHVDHIVPWDYVGDELNNNYQALCSACNGHKSNHVAESVKNLVFTQCLRGC